MLFRLGDFILQTFGAVGDVFAATLPDWAVNVLNTIMPLNSSYYDIPIFGGVGQHPLAIMLHGLGLTSWDEVSILGLMFGGLFGVLMYRFIIWVLDIVF